MTGAISASLLAFVDFTRERTPSVLWDIWRNLRVEKVAILAAFGWKGLGDPRRTVDRRHSRNHWECLKNAGKVWDKSIITGAGLVNQDDQLDFLIWVLGDLRSSPPCGSSRDLIKYMLPIVEWMASVFADPDNATLRLTFEEFTKSSESFDASVNRLLDHYFGAGDDLISESERSQIVQVTSHITSTQNRSHQYMQ